MKIHLSKEEVAFVYAAVKNKDDLRDWIDNKFWKYKILFVSELNGVDTYMTTSNIDRQIILTVEPKSEDEIYAAQLDYMLKQLDVHKPIKPLKPGQCPECLQHVAGWKPVFGGLAPEWWATQREHGINPATGHLQTCSKSK